MIIDFSVQNFGSIKDKQTLSFEADKSTQLEDYYVIKAGKYRLLKLALIYGANASGKTTILRALDFLRALVTIPWNKKTDELNFEPYLFDEITPKQNSIFTINFIHRNIQYFYELEFNNRYIVRDELNFYNPNKANVFTRTTNVEKQLSEITFGSKIKADITAEKNLMANTLWNNTVFGGFLKTNIDIPEIKNAVDWFNVYLKPVIMPDSNLSGYTLSGLKSSAINRGDIVNILRKADFNISDIIMRKLIVNEDFIKSLEKQNYPVDVIAEMKNEKVIDDLMFKHTLNNQSYDLAFHLESKGTQRYFGFAGILATLIKESTLIPIDELESSLHPDLYIHFLLTFLANAKQSQLIATTHNREILADKDIFRNDAIWFTDKSATGATELYSLADFDTSVVRDTSNVYNAYKTGKLGGVPNLGDYYIDLEK
jgi:AAA15 family ATPase/GTPase